MTIDQTFEDKKKEYKKLRKQFLKVTSNTLDEVKSGKDYSKLKTPRAIYNNTRKNVDIMLKGTNSAKEIAKKMIEIYSSLTDDEKKNLDEEVQSKK